MSEAHALPKRCPDAGTDSPGSEEPEALQPPSGGYDPDWRERIEIAKREHAQARKARGDLLEVSGHPRLPPLADSLRARHAR